jgi:hypothetical protein
VRRPQRALMWPENRVCARKRPVRGNRKIPHRRSGGGNDRFAAVISAGRLAGVGRTESLSGVNRPVSITGREFLEEAFNSGFLKFRRLSVRVPGRGVLCLGGDPKSRSRNNRRGPSPSAKSLECSGDCCRRGHRHGDLSSAGFGCTARSDACRRNSRLAGSRVAEHGRCTDLLGPCGTTAAAAV